MTRRGTLYRRSAFVISSSSPTQFGHRHRPVSLLLQTFLLGLIFFLFSPLPLSPVPGLHSIKDAWVLFSDPSSWSWSPPSLLKYRSFSPHTTSPFRSIMPGGAVVTGNGIGANAPRNVWAGVLSVRLPLLPPLDLPRSDRRPPCRPSSPPLVVSSSVMIPVSSPVSRP